MRHIIPIAIVVTATLLFSAGFAAIMGWFSAAGEGGSGRAVVSRPEAHVVPATARCGRCGVVESVRKVNKANNAAGFGAAAGGISGAAMGHQTGGGYGRELLTVIGAVLGAMVGNRYEEQARSSGVYEIAIRYEDGSSRVLTVLGSPAWKPGDRVRVIGGRILPDA